VRTPYVWASPQPPAPPPEASWAPLSEPWTDPQTGWSVVPARTRSDIGRIGEELENMLFIDSEADRAARDSERGAVRLAALEDADGVVRGFLQFAPRGGQPVLETARGHCDGAVPGAGAAAVQAYARGLSSGAIPALCEAGPDGFAAPSGAPVPVDPADLLAQGAEAAPALGRIVGPTLSGRVRDDHIADFGQARGWDGEWRDEDEDEDGHDDENGDENDDDDRHADGGADPAPREIPVAWTWTPLLSGDVEVGGTGHRAEAIADAVALARLGRDLGNDLRKGWFREVVVAACQGGTHQVVRIGDAEGSAAAVAYLRAEPDGRVAVARVFGPGADLAAAVAAVTDDARAAVDALVSDINSGVVPTDLVATADGFARREPDAAPAAMGW